MRFDRRRLFRTAGGGLAVASGLATLRAGGIAGAEPVRVGAIVDRTGPFDVYGQPQAGGLATACDELNAAGGLLGRPVELIVYDAASDDRLGAQHAAQALSRDGARVIQSGLAGGALEALRQVVRGHGGLLFSNALNEGPVCDPRHVATGTTPPQRLAPLVEHVVGERGAKRGYVVAADTAHGRADARWMQKLLRDAGGQDLAVELVPLGTTDFAPVLERVRRAAPEVVWSALMGGPHTAFYRQFESAIGKRNVPLASTTFGAGRENARLDPREREGLIVATTFVDGLDTEAARAFVGRFKAVSGQDGYVGEYAELGHRGVMLWADAVGRAGGFDPEEVAGVVARGDVQYQGAGGLYVVDGKTGHATMDVHVAVANAAGSFDVIQSFPQRPPLDAQAACDSGQDSGVTTRYDPKP